MVQTTRHINAKDVKVVMETAPGHRQDISGALTGLSWELDKPNSTIRTFEMMWYVCARVAFEIHMEAEVEVGWDVVRMWFPVPLSTALWRWVILWTVLILLVLIQT